MPEFRPAALNSSIRTKIATIVLAAVVSAVGLTSVTSALREADRRFQSKEAELKGVAAALAATVSYPLAKGSTADAGRALSAMREIPDVTFVQVLDAAGRSIIQFGDSVVLERPNARLVANDDISLFRPLLSGQHVLEAPIVNGGRRIGTLRIIANVSALRSALAESVTSAVLAGSLAALLGLLLASRLQRSITDPVKRLTSAILSIRTTGNTATVVERTSDDETGLMVDAFNDMLGQIRERDARLAAHRDRLEEEVKARTCELELATVAAEKANAAKSEFLATMSHEIRTPLNGMLVMAELMAAADLPERLQRHAGVIVNSGQSLLAIINDILDLSKIEAGRLELERIETAPAGVADDVTSLFAARAASKGLDLVADVARDVPKTILADPVRLNQVLANLINNALKFTETGSVTLRVEVTPKNDAVHGGTAAGTSSTTAQRDVCELRFSVTDTGIGIPEDKIALIFDPFSQADQSTTRRFGGTGIGLSISQKLVAAMGGTIAVESREGRGSTFSFSLPAEVVEPSAPRDTAHASVARAVVALPECATRRVLVKTLADLGVATEVCGDLGRDLSNPARTDLVVTLPTFLKDSADLFAGRARPRIGLLVDVGDINAGALIDEGMADYLLYRPLSRRDVAALVAGETSAPEPSHRAAAPPSLPFEGFSVLAADDSAVNREVLSEALARLGIKVTLVENGRAAAEAAAASAFSLVFMDCSMPVMDGYQATRAIRAREAASGTGPVPIIALTAHVAGMHADAWREAGMNATLTKPFTLKSLGRCLEQWLDRSASAVRPDGYGTLKAASAHTPSQEPVAAPSSAAGGTLAAGQAPSVTDAIQDSAPVLDAAVLDEIRAMQDADDDLVGRIAGLYRLHAPAALDRLDTAVTEGSPDKIAETAHALKSLCRNIGAVRLGNRLNEIERNARSGTWHKEQCPLPTLAQELDLVLAGLPGPHASKLKRDTPDRAANAPGAGSGASASPGNARRNASRGAS